jgi:arsenite methyltransferase
VTRLGNIQPNGIYEHLGVTDIAVEGIRPGGLQLTQRALTLSCLPPRSKVIDVGCGTGVTLEHIRLSQDHLAIGVDTSSNLLRFAKNRNRELTVVRASGEYLPLPNQFFDGLLAECSLSLMSYSDESLSEFGRVLKVDGKLILTDVYSRNPGVLDCPHDVFTKCCLRGAIPKEQIIRNIENKGFSINLWEDHSDLLKDFAVRLILSYGSLNHFWLQTTPSPVNPAQIREAVRYLKPGYFLLIGQKTALTSHVET